MESKEKKTVGIIGGMGPAATALFFQYIVKYTQAASDNKHIHVLIDNNTNIPDRTASILSGNDEPVKYIIDSGKRLISAGAELLAIPCNTSHYYYKSISAQLDVPVINMIKETVEYASSLEIKKIGLLATDGTIKTGVYSVEFRKKSIEMIYPDAECQKKVMSIIYNYVKANKPVPPGDVVSIVDYLIAKGCEGIILGCTELPFAIEKEKFSDMIIIDSLEVLAKRTIVLAGYDVITE